MSEVHQTCFAVEQLLMPTSYFNISSLCWTHPSLLLRTTFTCYICDKLTTMEAQMKRSCKSLAGSFFFFFFFSEGRKRGATEDAVNWNFKMVLIVCTFLHSCLSLIPPLYLNHTSNNDFEERWKSKRQHFGAFFWKRNRCVTDLHKFCAKYTLKSALCLIIRGERFWLKVLPLWICLIGITSHAVGDDSHDILLNLFLVLIFLMCYFYGFWMMYLLIER